MRVTIPNIPSFGRSLGPSAPGSIESIPNEVVWLGVRWNVPNDWLPNCKPTLYARRVVNGATWKVEARLGPAGESIPVSPVLMKLMMMERGRPRDMRTHGMFGFCMGVVKGDDSTITWDSEGMERAR